MGMLAQQSSVASLTLTTSLTLPSHPVRPRKQSCRSSSNRDNLTARSATLQDLTLARTEQRSFAQPATEDFLQHPSQLLDDRRLLQESDPCRSPLKVAVLLSGGVDSSCALHLLKKAGHHVTAFYLQIWFQEDFRNYWDRCPWEDDLDYCQQVCKAAGVELHTVPLTNQYWDRVVSHSIAQIKAGRTPNPDILCNSRVKFGAFYEYLSEQQDGNFDRIASGHYARILRADDPDEPVRLALAPDPVKDQTYFLAHLSQIQLSKVMFPLGHLTKAEVRSLAQAAGLPNQARRDSQGICFLGKVKFTEFVEQHLGEWPGCIIEEESGEVIGYHRGFWFHTVGQRRGIPLNGGPWYVTHKDIHTNTVYVSRDYYSVDKERNAFTCGGLNWINGPPNMAEPVRCKTRHGPTIYQCCVSFITDDQTALAVKLDGNDQGLASGQYAVFYQGEVCLGSGVIQTAGLSQSTGQRLASDGYSAVES